MFVKPIVCVTVITMDVYMKYFYIEFFECHINNIYDSKC